MSERIVQTRPAASIRADGVVAMTARDEPSVRDDAKRRGAEHFLAKPFLGRELVALLDSIVGRPPRTRRRGG